MNRRRLLSAYLTGLDLQAVFVATTTPAKVRLSDDPARACRDLARKAGGPVAPLAVFWCSSTSHAETLREMARAEMDGREMAPADLADLVERLAAELGIRTATDAEIEANAAATVARVEVEFEQLRRTGGLKRLNVSYRQQREAAGAEGRKMVSYSLWLAQEKAKMVRRMAEGVRIAARSGFGAIPVRAPSAVRMPNIL